MADDKILSSYKNGKVTDSKLITNENGIDNSLNQDKLQPLDIKTRIRKSTLSNGLVDLPLGFDEQNGDWICIESSNPFEILYLDYTQYKFITPWIITNNYTILEKFWKDKVGIMNTGGNRVAFKNKYGEGTIEDSLLKLKKAKEKLSTELGIENYYNEINNERIYKWESILTKELDKLTRDGDLSQTDFEVIFEMRSSIDLTDEELAIVIQKLIKEKEFISVINIKGEGWIEKLELEGNNLLERLLSVTWMTREKIIETKNSVLEVKLGYATIRTDKDFIDILETRSSWWEDLFEDIDTYFALKAWLGSYQNIESRKIFDNMIHFYKPLGKEYVKESAMRFFDPEREIRIEMNSFNFFNTDNIEKEVESYISKLDDIWKITSIDKIIFNIFQLEFSIQQLKKSSNHKNKIVVYSLIDKLYSVFGLIQNSFDDFKTEIQTKINTKDEIITFGLLINLFRSFNPERTFKDSKNNAIYTIYDLGIFYILNQTAFTDKYLNVEKEVFLNIMQKSLLTKSNYLDFIFEIFKNETTIHVELIEMNWDKKVTLSIKYNINKSLDNYLRSKSIIIEFPNYIMTSEIIELKVHPLFLPYKMMKVFLQNTSQKHNFSLSLITFKNYEKLNKEFKKHYSKTFKINSLIIFFTTSLIIGIGIGHLSIAYVDEIYNPLLNYSFFKSLTNDFIVGLTFALISSSLFYFKYLYRRILTLSLGALLIVLNIYLISNNFNEIEKIFNYRHDFYINNFNVIETNPKIFISNKDIYRSIVSEIEKFGKEYTPLYSVNLSKSYLQIQSQMPIIERTFYDPGFLQFWQTIFTEIGYLRSDYSFCAYFNLRDISDFRKEKFYPIKISLNANMPDASEMARFGIRINQYDILINNSYLEFGEIKDFPEMDKKDYQKTKRYYIVIEKNNNLSYTGGKHTDNFRNDRPNGVSLPVPIFKSLAKSNFESSLNGEINLSIYFLQNSFFIEVNSKRILSTEFKWNFDYQKFIDGIGLIFEPKANFKISNITLTSLTENGRYDNRKDGKNHKYISIIAKANEPIKLLKTTDNISTINSIINKGSNVDVLYFENGFYKIHNILTNEMGFCEKSKINNLEWDKSQVF